MAHAGQGLSLALFFWRKQMAIHSDETKLKDQSGDMPAPMKPPKPIDRAMRSSKPGLPYTGAPGHSMPK